MGTGTGNFCVEKFLLSGHEKAAKSPLIGDLSCFFANFCINSFLALFARKPYVVLLERMYKPYYDYKNFSPLADGTYLNRQKYAIVQTHWQ